MEKYFINLYMKRFLYIFCAALFLMAVFPCQAQDEATAPEQTEVSQTDEALNELISKANATITQIEAKLVSFSKSTSHKAWVSDEGKETVTIAINALDQAIASYDTGAIEAGIATLKSTFHGVLPFGLRVIEIFGVGSGPWQVFLDAGIILLLLLLGKLCRAKIKLVQSLFIPPSLLAGILALSLGPNGLYWLPLSNNLGTYSAILIAVVFAALPLASPSFKIKEVAGKVGPMWAYSQFGMFFQWAAIGIIGILFLTPVFGVESPFGIMCPVGFYGGHGTAAAMGDTFAEMGWPDALSLGMTTATVGVVLGVIFGVMLIKIATKRHQTSYVTDFAELPNELRSGLIPAEKRDSLGKSTISSISLEHFTFHLAIVIVCGVIGYLVSKGVKTAWPKLDIPVFLSAYLIGLLAKLILDKTKASYYVEQKTISSISGTATDLLVACGVGAINLNVVTGNAVPLVVLLAIGIAVTLFMCFYFARHLYKEDWFEKAIFAWGWWTGTMAIGIALLRIVDPKNESHALDNYALAFLPCAPIEIILILSVPIAYQGGWLLWLCLGYLVLSFLILLLAKKLGWWIPGSQLKAAKK